METAEDKSDNWDPAPRARTYYKRIDSGDLGYLVRRDGKDAVRYDRGDSQELLSSEMGRWRLAEVVNRVHQIPAARVAFEADKALCMALGDHALSRRDWLSLRDKDRIKWMQGGPGADADPLRQELWTIISAFLKAAE